MKSLFYQLDRVTYFASTMATHYSGQYIYHLQFYGRFATHRKMFVGGLNWETTTGKFLRTQRPLFGPRVL